MPPGRHAKPVLEYVAIPVRMRGPIGSMLRSLVGMMSFILITSAGSFIFLSADLKRKHGMCVSEAMVLRPFARFHTLSWNNQIAKIGAIHPTDESNSSCNG